MAIARLKKVTLVGVARDKENVLLHLQDLGILHLVDISREPVGMNLTDPFKDARSAVSYLESCPQRQRPLRKSPRQFRPEVTISQILKLKARSEQLKDESEHLQRQIELLEPWGNFDLPTSKELSGLQMYFYIIPHRFLKKISEADLIYQVVNEDNRYKYVVVIHDSVPPISLTPIALPSHSLEELQEKLEDILDELERCETRRIGETRLINLLQEYLDRALDDRELMTATQKTYDDEGLFAMQGWCPVKLIDQVHTKVSELGLACETSDPSPEDTPPTFMENHDLIAPGETLINLYGIPDYHTWDPSLMVYFSFIIFFAMILSDAGYGLILLALTFILRSRLIKSGNKRFFYLLLALSISSTFYGMISGTYFGITPKSDNWLSFAKPLMIFDATDLENLPVLMAASIFIGCLHIGIANLISMYNNRRNQKALSYFGWVLVVFSAYGAWITRFFMEQPNLSNDLLYLVGLGLALVFLFAHPAPLTLKGTLSRVLGGVHSLLEITKIFGDVLSYLRLFALGLAGGYLAITFNQLAHDAAHIQPVGFLLSFVIIVIGHTINFALAILGGVIHGLRLNFIEFYNWSLSGEGFLFQPFRKNVKN